MVNGIKKLLGSFPFLKRIIELTNNKINIIMKSNKVVRLTTQIIKSGFIIATPRTTTKPYPKRINATKLNKIVANNPRKSCINLFVFCILGGIIPIYKWVVSLEIKTVEISPVNEFKAGKITVIIGNPYKILKLVVKTDPVNNPILDDHIKDGDTYI